MELGYGIPDRLRLVPVDFEGGDSWPEQLAAAGFDSTRPAVVVSTGVTMYLTRDATAATLRRIAGLAPGTTLAMTFLPPPELVAPADRPGLRTSKEGPQTSGTPFLSFCTPQDMLSLAHEAGFADARHVPGSLLADRYFADRGDGLRPSSGEDFLPATT
ncbi:class I SAM-dependent methyltransferase [Streptomyces sp. NPDC056061]|uniref:class I SAM-dependent methyltransferase n=1 Tax=Streptomyces sp. NPDC056061 TaxID=3345700 RepID=UPI0035D6A9BE